MGEWTARRFPCVALRYATLSSDPSNDGEGLLSDEQVKQLADAVAAKLNGQLSGIRKDMEAGFAKVERRLDGVEGRPALRDAPKGGSL